MFVGLSNQSHTACIVYQWRNVRIAKSCRLYDATIIFHVASYLQCRWETDALSWLCSLFGGPAVCAACCLSVSLCDIKLYYQSKSIGTWNTISVSCLKILKSACLYQSLNSFIHVIFPELNQKTVGRFCETNWNASVWRCPVAGGRQLTWHC